MRNVATRGKRSPPLQTKDRRGSGKRGYCKFPSEARISDPIGVAILPNEICCMDFAGRCAVPAHTCCLCHTPLLDTCGTLLYASDAGACLKVFQAVLECPLRQRAARDLGRPL